MRRVRCRKGTYADAASHLGLAPVQFVHRDVDDAQFVLNVVVRVFRLQVVPHLTVFFFLIGGLQKLLPHLLELFAFVHLLGGARLAEEHGVTFLGMQAVLQVD